MDRVAAIIADDPSTILNNDILFDSVFKAFSNLNYAPEKWDILREIFLEHPSLTKVWFSNFFWVKLYEFFVLSSLSVLIFVVLGRKQTRRGFVCKFFNASHISQDIS